MSWRTILERGAPMATRIAISRLRDVARASSRFATFAQATSSTIATTPAIIFSGSQSPSRALRLSAVARLEDHARQILWLIDALFARMFCLTTASKEEVAVAAETPERRRAMSRTHQKFGSK